ncbi:hypothetical protein [Rhizobium sp. SSA_523]|nr:hypothetical protein [Rhizobium sp. SSA_523]MCO5730705.1 hypothetical protein [Rhizobium sp. SSA_523]WKC24468.1 hypothetical protein QTJ18_10440 [Rhizobium sp. SSA_523]
MTELACFRYDPVGATIACRPDRSTATPTEGSTDESMRRAGAQDGGFRH